MNILKVGGLDFTRFRNSLLIILFAVSGCTLVNLQGYDTERFYFDKIIPLHLDGYYYRSTYPDDLLYILFLYRDGSSLSMGGFPSEKSLRKYLDKLSQEELRNYRSMDTGWGGFYFRDQEIVIQTAALLNLGSVGITQMKGEVINDSTFRITQFYNRGEISESEVLYKFKSFSPKPDSVNWVKERVERKK